MSTPTTNRTGISTMSDTPRTKEQTVWADTGIVRAYFAEQLERELNAANQISKKYEDRYFASLDRIKRLEEAGGRMASMLKSTREQWYSTDQCEVVAFDWEEAKEAKP